MASRVFILESITGPMNAAHQLSDVMDVEELEKALDYAELISSF